MRRNLAKLSTPLAALLAVVGAAVAQSPEGEGHRRAIPPPHDPSHAATAATWCGLHLGRREFDQALSDCDYAVATQSGNPGAFSNRGSVYLVLGLLAPRRFKWVA